jgi:alkylation response protein AidB-like acyl-CoA dehydrogenase
LNRVIDFAHENRLTRHQQVMFALADMMTHVEVADSMARLAAKEADDNHPGHGSGVCQHLRPAGGRKVPHNRSGDRQYRCRRCR